MIFLADATWPALASLAASGVASVPIDTSAARDIGLRATPTTITLEPSARRVANIEVGISAIDRRFTLPREH